MPHVVTRVRHWLASALLALGYRIAAHLAGRPLRRVRLTRYGAPPYGCR